MKVFILLVLVLGLVSAGFEPWESQSEPDMPQEEKDEESMSDSESADSSEQDAEDENDDNDLGDVDEDGCSDSVGDDDVEGDVDEESTLDDMAAFMKRGKKKSQATHVHVEINLPKKRGGCRKKVCLHQKGKRTRVKRCIAYGYKNGCRRWGFKTMCLKKETHKFCQKHAGKCTKWKTFLRRYPKKCPGKPLRVCKRRKVVKVCLKKKCKHCLEWGTKVGGTKRVCAKRQKKCEKTRVCVDKGRTCIKQKKKLQCVKRSREGTKMCKKKVCKQYKTQTNCKRKKRYQVCVRYKNSSKTVPGKACCKKYERQRYCAKRKTGTKCVQWGTIQGPQKCKYVPNGRVCAKYKKYKGKCTKYCTKKCKKTKWIRIWAEPHMTTLDGAEYLLNTIGTLWYILPMGGTNPLSVQVQNHPAHVDGKRAQGTEFTAIAVKVGADLVEFYAKGEIYINKQLIPHLTNHPLANGGTVVRSHEGEVVVISPEHHVAVAAKRVQANQEWILNVNTRLGEAAKPLYKGGLVGNWNGNPADDDILKNIKDYMVPQPKNYFAKYPYFPTYKYNALSMEEFLKLPAEKTKFAYDACTAKGLKDNLLKDCAFDVFVTHFTGFADIEKKAEDEKREDAHDLAAHSLTTEQQRLIDKSKFDAANGNEVADNETSNTDSDEEKDDDEFIDHVIAEHGMVADSDSALPKCYVGRLKGNCINTSKLNCGGKLWKGKCKGPANIKCCTFDWNVMGKAKWTNLTCGRSTKSWKHTTCNSKNACKYDGSDRTHMCKIGRSYVYKGRIMSMYWKKAGTETVNCPTPNRYCCGKYPTKTDCVRWVQKKKRVCTPGATKRVCKKHSGTNTCIKWAYKKKCILKGTCGGQTVPGKKICVQKKWKTKCLDHNRKRTCVKYGYVRKPCGKTNSKCLKYQMKKWCVKWKGTCKKYKLITSDIKCSSKCVKWKTIPGKRQRYCKKYQHKGCKKWGKKTVCARWQKLYTKKGKLCYQWKRVKKCIAVAGKCARWASKTVCTKQGRKKYCLVKGRIRFCKRHKWVMRFVKGARKCFVIRSGLWILGKRFWRRILERGQSFKTRAMMYLKGLRQRLGRRMKGKRGGAKRNPRRRRRTRTQRRKFKRPHVRGPPRKRKTD